MFSGFSPEAFRFLKRLKKNNDRDWFLPRKTEFEELLKNPMLELIEELAERLSKSAPEVRIDRKSLLRIYRDTRFSKDKSPYKTNLGASFDLHGYPKSVSSPGLYLHVSPGEIFVGGGLYMPDARQLRHIRYAIDQHPDEYLQFTDRGKFRTYFGEIHGDCLKKAPQGYLPDHPQIEHLRRKQFFVLKNFSEAQAGKASFVKQVADVCDRTMPFVRWLKKNSGGPFL